MIPLSFFVLHRVISSHKSLLWLMLFDFVHGIQKARNKITVSAIKDSKLHLTLRRDFHDLSPNAGFTTSSCLFQATWVADYSNWDVSSSTFNKKPAR